MINKAQLKKVAEEAGFRVLDGGGSTLHPDGIYAYTKEPYPYEEADCADELEKFANIIIQYCAQDYCRSDNH